MGVGRRSSGGRKDKEDVPYEEGVCVGVPNEGVK